jgi:hypothetical protein
VEPVLFFPVHENFKFCRHLQLLIYFRYNNPTIAYCVNYKALKNIRQEAGRATAAIPKHDRDGDSQAGKRRGAAVTARIHTERGRAGEAGLQAERGRARRKIENEYNNGVPLCPLSPWWLKIFKIFGSFAVLESKCCCPAPFE